MKTNEIIELNKKRFVSQTTKITCATCGSEFKINNREILHFNVDILNEKLCKIWMRCPDCDTDYDLGICKYK